MYFGLLVLLLGTCCAFQPITNTLAATSADCSGSRRCILFITRDDDISFDVLVDKNVLVVGGSGRVGGSVVTQLIKRGAVVTVGGTSFDSFMNSKQRWQALHANEGYGLGDVDFARLDRESKESVSAALQKKPYDLVVHTAGPFQGKVKTPNGVIDGCISSKVPYVDVCDDYCTASAAKSRHMDKAREIGVPCIISTGCWPGVSSLMAKQLVAGVLAANTSLKPQDLTVDFNFFTAGSGGAGSTLLVATFLILSEEALTIVNGRRKPIKAMRKYSLVNFGDVVGEKAVAPMNLLETASVHDALGVGNAKARFGTQPGFWNTLLGLMAELPPSLLSNERIMTKLAIFSLPIVRVVDFFAGATNAMRCDVTSEKAPGLQATAIYAHENLEPCVGECVVAFCCAVLSGKVVPGVWFPEEAIAGGADASAVLSLASVGAHTLDVVTSGNIDLKTSDLWGVQEARELDSIKI
jgi:saccharopine dehydrogenase-like NADP-dependent oxidoreductase